MKKLDHHESDLNAVRFLPTGDALGTATNDGVVSGMFVAPLPPPPPLLPYGPLFEDDYM